MTFWILRSDINISANQSRLTAPTSAHYLTRHVTNTLSYNETSQETFLRPAGFYEGLLDDDLDTMDQSSTNFNQRVKVYELYSKKLGLLLFE